jgi:hypothetical protein
VVVSTRHRTLDQPEYRAVPNTTARERQSAGPRASRQRASPALLARIASLRPQVYTYIGTSRERPAARPAAHPASFFASQHAALQLWHFKKKHKVLQHTTYYFFTPHIQRNRSPKHPPPHPALPSVRSHPSPQLNHCRFPTRSLTAP